jgi:hypothetical protein
VRVCREAGRSVPVSPARAPAWPELLERVWPPSAPRWMARPSSRALEFARAQRMACNSGCAH